MNDSERDSLLGRLETKVDTLLERQGDHETRIRSLEVTKNRALGWAAAISAAIATATAWLTGSK